MRLLTHAEVIKETGVDKPYLQNLIQFFFKAKPMGQGNRRLFTSKQVREIKEVVKLRNRIKELKGSWKNIQ